jgi:5'-3' exonuclease
MHLITHFQDTVNDTAIEYHRKLRDKEITKSRLDNIEGIGEVRKKELLKRFGSVEKIKQAKNGRSIGLRIAYFQISKCSLIVFKLSLPAYKRYPTISVKIDTIPYQIPITFKMFLVFSFIAFILLFS